MSEGAHYGTILLCLLVIKCVVILSQPSIMPNYIGQKKLRVLSAALTYVHGYLGSTAIGEEFNAEIEVSNPHDHMVWQ